jgi:tyrosinase
MGRFGCLALLFVGAMTGVEAAPCSVEQAVCKTKVQHKPWGMLTAAEQSSYVKAELCLMNTPAKTGIAGAKTVWDELQWNHIYNAHAVHDVGQFLPWHRNNLAIHGNFLRDDCGYKGPLPYWDETADSSLASVADAAIFQPDAFGGDGSGEGKQKFITNGPFVNITLRMQGKNQDKASYRIYRNLNDTVLASASPPAMNACFRTSTYPAFWECLGGAAHGGGHGAAGGLMMDVQASPGDPVFYLHHGWLDAMWWKWQSMDLSNRLTDMGGRNIPLKSYVDKIGLEKPGPEFTDYHGDPGNVTTLDHILSSTNLAPNVTVRDVMDVASNVVCAEYLFSDDVESNVNAAMMAAVI